MIIFIIFNLVWAQEYNLKTLNNKNFFCQCGNIGHSLITLPLNLQNIKNIVFENINVFVPSKVSSLRAAASSSFVYEFKDFEESVKKMILQYSKSINVKILEDDMQYKFFIENQAEYFKSKLWNSLNITSDSFSVQLKKLNQLCKTDKDCVNVKIEGNINLNKPILKHIEKGTENEIVKDKLDYLYSCKRCIESIIYSHKVFNSNVFLSISDVFLSKDFSISNSNIFGEKLINIFNRNKQQINDLYLIYGNIYSVKTIIDYFIDKYAENMNILMTKRKFFTKHFSNIYNKLNISIIYDQDVLETMYYDNVRGETYENPYLEDSNKVIDILIEKNIYPYNLMSLSADNANIRLIFSKSHWNSDKINSKRLKRKNENEMNNKIMKMKLDIIGKRETYWFSPWFIPKNMFQKDRNYKKRIEEIYNITKTIIQNNHLDHIYFFTEHDIVLELKNIIEKTTFTNTVNIVIYKRIKFCEIFKLADKFIEMNRNKNNLQNSEDNEIRIFANSDVYPSINFFKKLKNDPRLIDKDTSFALTRWNVDKKIMKNNLFENKDDYCNHYYEDVFFKYGSSQDAWIFSGKLNEKSKNCTLMGDFYFGLPGCDSVLSSQLRDIAGYKRTINPSLTYKICHEHSFGLRTYLGVKGIETVKGHHTGLATIH